MAIALADYILLFNLSIILYCNFLPSVIKAELECDKSNAICFESTECTPEALLVLYKLECIRGFITHLHHSLISHNWIPTDPVFDILESLLKFIYCP